MSERHDSAWWRNQYPGWPSMSRGRMEMLFSDLAATEAERDEYKKLAIDLAWRDDAERLREERDEHKRNASVMAATQCIHDMRGDDYGNAVCPMEAEVKALREALEKYGEHRADCNADLSEGDDVYPCTRGPDALGNPVPLRCHCGWTGDGDETVLDGKDGEQPWMVCPDCGTWLIQVPELNLPALREELADYRAFFDWHHNEQAGEPRRYVDIVARIEARRKEETP